MLQMILLPLLLISKANVGAFQLHQSPSTAHHGSCNHIILSSSCMTQQQRHTYLQASKNDENATGDNKAMAFLRKKGRIGGAANMDFANAIGLDESPSGGSKSALHEDGFKVSV